MLTDQLDDWKTQAEAVKSPLGVANGPVTMARDEREPGEQREDVPGLHLPAT